MATIIVRSSISELELPYQATLTAIDLPDSPVLALPYNPESWQISGGAEWKPRGAAGIEYDASDWIGNAPRKITLKHTFAARDYARQLDDGSFEVDWDKLMEVETILRTIEDWARRPTEQTDQPTRILLTLGFHEYEVTIVDYQCSRMMTDAHGNALVADLSLTLQEV